MTQYHESSHNGLVQTISASSLLAPAALFPQFPPLLIRLFHHISSSLLRVSSLLSLFVICLYFQMLGASSSSEEDDDDYVNEDEVGLLDANT